MPKNVDKIADVLGAKVVARLPRTGGGAFGAARLAAIVERLQARLAPAMANGRAAPRMPTGCIIPRFR